MGKMNEQWIQENYPTQPPKEVASEPEVGQRA